MDDQNETTPEEGTGAASSPLLRLLLIGVSITVIIAGIRMATSVITTVFLAFVISVPSTPRT